MSADLAALVARLEQVADRLEKLVPGSGAAVVAAVKATAAGASSTAAAPAASGNLGSEFQAILDEKFKAFVDAAQPFTHPKKIIPQVTAGLKSVQAVIAAAPNAKKPTAQEILAVMNDLATAINEADTCAFEAEITREGDHVKLVHESLALFSFPLFTATGKEFVDMANGYCDASQMYGNNVLKKANTGSDATLSAQDRAYATAYKEFLTTACKFICTNFAAKGLPWKAEGGLSLADAVKNAASGASAPAAPAVPASAPVTSAPAASPALTKSTSVPEAAPSGGEPRSGLFSQLKQGLDITSRLRHVTKEEKLAFKAAAESAPIVEPEAKSIQGPGAAPVAAPVAAPAPVAAKQAPVKEPKISRQDFSSKVFVDNYVNDKTLNFGDLPNSYSLFAGNCKNSTITVPQKLKAISIDGCQRLHVNLESVLTTVEIVNSKNVVLSINGHVPTVVMDKSSGCIVALSESAKATPPQLVTSNISECNVQLPNPLKINKDDDEVDDVVELPIPEQFTVDIHADTAKLQAKPVAHG